ncbi:hypothetical protein AB0F18_21810 [Streptomyces sp. NPDC029216]|uniref:hypothetical protein n=1 Tax=Streptomyces sp. NPDC029216 TaxID=3154701 RepID=UPI0033C46CC3
MGIRAIVATGGHGETEAALRHVRRHFITVDTLRAAVTKPVNATALRRGRTGAAALHPRRPQAPNPAASGGFWRHPLSRMITHPMSRQCLRIHSRHCL